jgi:hypothetical protein
MVYLIALTECPNSSANSTTSTPHWHLAMIRCHSSGVKLGPRHLFLRFLYQIDDGVALCVWVGGLKCGCTTRRFSRYGARFKTYDLVLYEECPRAET